MIRKKQIIGNIILATAIAFLSTGCSLKDPFGIGYNESVSEGSKDFGVSGSPKDIYNDRDKIRKVQTDYLESNISSELFFAIDKKSNILVKEDRDGDWERYDLSGWRTIIEDSLLEKKEKELEMQKEIAERDKAKNQVLKRSANFSSIDSDLPVTKGNDLSIKYQEQGPLVVSRTRVGDIIRDNGLIQQVFVANYVDHAGDLVASHELYVVVKDSEWVVGEKTPKSVKIDSIPTPISKKLLTNINKSSKYENTVVNEFNIDNKAGVIRALANDPVKKNKENRKDMDLINSFINK